MTVQTQAQAFAAGEHVVQFYEHDSELCFTLGNYLADAIYGGGVAIIIATEVHRRALAAELRAAGLDPADAVADGTLVALDAAATLAKFSANGRIDAAAFRRVVGTVVRDAAQAWSSVRAYGEMVALLWDAGHVIAAIELEQLWNELGRELQFSLLCGYHTTSVSDPEHAEALQQACHLHTAVLHPPRHQTRDAHHTQHVDWPGVEVSRQFPPQDDAPRAARRFVANALRQWGHNGTLLEDAQLVVSELTTNAVLHARSPFTVLAHSDSSRLRLSVQDGSPIEPILRSNGHNAASGRGLHVVAALTRDWGVDATNGGKAVWAELRR